uniref:Uncharacterized protein n=1 Tax=Arundo donax TaxID=35708 RepID=A0A0A9GNB5_ARUDO
MPIYPSRTVHTAIKDIPHHNVQRADAWHIIDLNMDKLKQIVWMLNCSIIRKRRGIKRRCNSNLHPVRSDHCPKTANVIWEVRNDREIHIILFISGPAVGYMVESNLFPR